LEEYNPEQAWLKGQTALRELGGTKILNASAPTKVENAETVGKKATGFQRLLGPGGRQRRFNFPLMVVGKTPGTKSQNQTQEKKKIKYMIFAFYKHRNQKPVAAHQLISRDAWLADSAVTTTILARTNFPATAFFIHGLYKPSMNRDRGNRRLARHLRSFKTIGKRQSVDFLVKNKNKTNISQ